MEWEYDDKWKGYVLKDEDGKRQSFIFKQTVIEFKRDGINFVNGVKLPEVEEE